MKEHSTQVTGLMFQLSLNNLDVAKRIVPHIKVCPVKLHIILLRHCSGVLLQVFNIRYDKSCKKYVYILIANIYSGFPDVNKLFPYFNNMPETANIFENDNCEVEICINQFSIKYTPKKNMDLYTHDIFFCEKILNCDRKYVSEESLGKCGLTFTTKQCGELSIDGCDKKYAFTGTRFMTYLTVCKPERYVCDDDVIDRCESKKKRRRKYKKRKHHSSSSNGSSDCSECSFEKPINEVQQIIIDDNKNMVVQDDSESDIRIDDEEYFFIKNPPPVRNIFGNPFMPNWKLTTTNECVTEFIDKIQKKSQGIDVMSVKSSSAYAKNKRNIRPNPFEPRVTDLVA